MAVFEIPTDNSSPAFTFNSSLDGSNYRFEFRWNDRVNLWIFNMIDDEDVPLFLGKPYQSGINFLQQVSSTKAPRGVLFCDNATVRKKDPDRFSMGVDVKFYYNDKA